MNDRPRASDDPERIEIELISEDGSSPFARPAPTDASMATSSPRHGSPTSRTAIIAIGVGVVALVVGWALGRSSDDGSAEPPAVAEETAVERSDSNQTIPAAPAVVITAPQTTSPTLPEAGSGSGSGSSSSSSEAAGEDSMGEDASALGAAVETEVVVAAGLSGQPIEIVAYGSGRQFFELDLMTSTLSAREVTTQPFGPTRLLLGSDWAILASSDPDFPSTFVPRSGPKREVELGPSWQIVGVADDESLWTAIPPDEADAASVVRRRMINGDLAEEIALVPAPPPMVDPAGGVVVEVSGAAARVAPEAALSTVEGAFILVDPVIESITTGRLIALGVHLAVAEECDERLVCSLVTIDRATGARTSIGGVSRGGLAPYLLVRSATISPDESMAVVEMFDPLGRASSQRSLGVMSLATGAVTEIGPVQAIDQVAWTPDGRFVLFIQGGRLVAYDTETGATDVVIDELFAMNAFGVRPLDPAS